MAISLQDWQDHSIERQFETCRAQYAGQKGRTMRASQDANKELKRLLQAVHVPEELLRGAKDGSPPNFEMPENAAELADVKKLLFMNTQVSLAKSILENLLAQDSAWESADFVNEPTEEQKTKRIAHYQTACRLLEAMQRAFEDAAGIDSSLFGPVWQASIDILKEYPKACFGGVGAAGLVGALAGGGHVSLHIGFRAFLTATFGEATLGTGALAGGLAGVVIGGVVIGLIVLYQRWTKNKEEADAEELRVMKQKIAKIGQQELSQKELLELEDLFIKAFQRPMNLARKDVCPICLDHFRADGGNSAEWPIKAPRCVGDHMVHQKCLRTWQWKSADDTCILCRQ
eukprot:TRINITY_DN849_c0_g1_i1.p1 TRINITY_DN849_c0_g1~~TRINITY_DN849_c0_g1_i1.p1  ORF type:complete len:344 (-),score=80.10 TRINITY_DN849_c0_g1_i1:234-1265(-)